MTLEELLQQHELLEQYEQHKKNILKANGDSRWDYDHSVLNIELEIGKDFKGSSTKIIEESSVKQMQEFYDRPIELKNATAGVKDATQATILVEYQQHKRIENRIELSGISVTEAGHQIFTLDRIGHFAFEVDFLKFCHQYNRSLKSPIFNDGPLASQEGGNQGYAYRMRYNQFAFMFLKYWEHLKNTSQNS